MSGKTTSTINASGIANNITSKDKKKKSKGQSQAHSNFLLQGPHLAPLLDHRSYFRNKEDTPSSGAQNSKDGSVSALKQWFESLSV